MKSPMKYHWKYVLYVLGLVVIVLLILVVLPRAQKASAISMSPSSGPEGTEVTISYPKSVSLPAGPLTVKFYDAGAHGYYAVNNGAATYVSYDPATGQSYTATAEATTASDADHVSYSAEVPAGICGLIIQSSQDVPAPPKMLGVSLVGPDGQEVPGGSGSFGLVCDKYTLKVAIKSSKDPVLPDGVDQSTITATLSVTGPAQFVNGTRVKPSDPKIMITSPLGLVMVHFDNSLGTIAPSPANVKTDLNGDAVVTVSSADAGIDKVQAIASGIGDAIVNVHFEPKITGVKEDFVEPNSPTNYQISTIPADASNLDVNWEIVYPKGAHCGSLTGAADGMGLTKNGYFHGPTNDYPNGCNPVNYEAFVQIKVIVTDKDGQSDSKTFSARGLEGQGLVKFPQL